MPTIKQQIIWDLGPEINAHKDDANSWGRRNFGLYIEGSYGYDGEKTYEASKEYVERYQFNKRKMRSFVIHGFTAMVALEYACSFGYAQQCVNALADKEILATYTSLLITDAIEQFL